MPFLCGEGSLNYENSIFSCHLSLDSCGIAYTILVPEHFENEMHFVKPFALTLGVISLFIVFVSAAVNSR